MDIQKLFQKAEGMVKSGESASMWAAIRYVVMVELSKTEGANTMPAVRKLSNEIWDVARQHGYEVG